MDILLPITGKRPFLIKITRDMKEAAGMKHMPEPCNSASRAYCSCRGMTKSGAEIAL